MLKFFCATFLLCIIGQAGFTQVIPDFTIPDTVCVNEPINITNTSVGASTYFWNFCTANLSSAPVITNLGNPGNQLNTPVFIDYVFDNGNYYGFVTNYNGGNLIRLDFGNSLLNTPTAANLGNFNGDLPATIGSEGIQIVKQNGEWFAIIVGGNSAMVDKPRLIKIAFGPNITNPSPVSTNWNNIGGMNQPIDLHLYEDAGHWYGFTLNSEDNSITRFDFTTSFNNVPTGTNLGNLGDLSYPTGIFVTNDNGFWRAFVVNAGDNTRTNSKPSSLTRLDFGSSLLNTPVGINLGNPGGLLQHPRDLTIMKSCDQIIAFAVNGNLNNADLVRMDFNNNITSTPVGSIAGNMGNGTFPHCISKLFRDKADVYGFVANVSTGSLMRLRFPGCSNSSQGNSSDKNPTPITYNAPGTYNINLTVDDGLPTQQMTCKKIVVLENFISDFTYEQDVCDPLNVKFVNNNPRIPTPSWVFGDGNTDNTTLTPTHRFPAFGSYTVKFFVKNNKCTDTITKVINLSLAEEDIVLTPDTIICEKSTKQLRAKPALRYCWTPNLYLNDASIANPVTSTPVDITYYCTALIKGNNLVVNGDFSAGNTGFISDYQYKPPPNVNAGEYFVGPSSQAWHSGMSDCRDHTGNNGNMMLVNGATVVGAKVWSQTIAVTPNTNYEFSTWIQTLNNATPAELQFSINNQPLGNPLISGTACNWMQFYTTWNSGNATTATITIINKNQVYSGNDFGLDDISFSTFQLQRDSVKIAIDTPDVNTRTDTTICNNISLKLPATGAITWSWTPGNSLSDPVIADPVATPAATTEYIVTGINVNGCIAKDTVLITVIPPLTLDITPDTTICSNAPVPLRALTTGAPVYHWVPATGLSDPGIANPIASPLTPTKYFVDLEDVNGCVTSDSIMVDFIPRPNFTATAPLPVCFDEESKMEATGGDTYRWAPADQLDDPTSPTPVVKARLPVSYSVHISESFCNYDTLVQFAPLQIYPLPLVSTRTDTTICKDISLKLPATGAGIWSWTPASTLSDPTLADPVASPAVTTEYIVSGTSADGCIGKDTVLITVIQPLTLDITPDTTICSNALVQLRALAAGNPAYHWYPSAGLNNPGTATPLVSPKTPTKYFVELTDSYSCVTRDSIMVDLVPRPAFFASAPQGVCYDTETQLLASGGDTYQWAPADFLDDPASPTPVVRALAPVSYSVRISESFCGYDSLVQFAPLQVYPLPVVHAIKESDINCVVRSAQLRASGGFNYSWSPASALDNPRKRDPIAIVDTSTQFIVTATSQYGCKKNDTLMVLVTKTGTPVFEVPNAFTPNGDGKNDCFGIKKWGVVRLESFEVYNRWGQKLFQTNRPDECWDGTFKGQRQDSGEFVYIIKASTFCGPFLRKGVFFLIR